MLSRPLFFTKTTILIIGINIKMAIIGISETKNRASNAKNSSILINKFQTKDTSLKSIYCVLKRYS